MPFERAEAKSWVPISEQDKAEVLQQLGLLVENPYFNHSKRYPSFLKFVISETLAGRASDLKERTLGVEVFERDPDYDTANDPIVRVTAAEIRKRIAQYYQEPGHDDEIRVALPSGSYVPHFYKPSPDKPALDEATPEQDAEAVAAPEAAGTQTKASGGIFSRKLIAVLTALALATGGAGLWRMLRSSPMDDFWQPFVSSDAPTLFCIADQNYFSTITLRDAGDPQRQSQLNDRMLTVIIDDISPLVDIAGMLQVHNKSYKVKGEAQTTLTDLRQGPSIFIGAFDNNWTLRTTKGLRFHFANDNAMSKFWIEDRQNPSLKNWLVDRTVQQETGTYKDYALVARFVDPDTDRPVVVVAGLARGGTVAAGEFLVKPELIRDLARQLPPGWKNKNIEVVLETQVIDGRSGPPRVAATFVW